MRVMLITNYWHFPSEKSSTRYATLADHIIARGHELEVVTSNFHHARKRQRTASIVEEVEAYAVTLVPEPGYKQNISVRRLVSHRVLASRIARHLQAKTLLPDVIYCVVPSLDVATAVASFAHDRGIPLVIDIQDLWPEAFIMALPKPLHRVLSLPMKRQAKHIYGAADGVVAVSETYRQVALIERTGRPSATVFLGTDLATFDAVTGEPSLHKEDGTLWLTYVGSLGHSYDLPTAMRAAQRVARDASVSFTFVVVGDGPRRQEFERLGRRLELPMAFLGYLAYGDVVRVLKRSDIAINSIAAKSEATIINKHADYFAAGLPVVNNQRSDELKRLLNDWEAGLSCAAGSVEAMSCALSDLATSESLRKRLGAGARRLAEALFDRRKTYPTIVDVLTDVSHPQERV